MENKPILTKLLNDIQNGTEIEDIIEYTKDFENLMAYYWCAMQEVETKFRVLDKQLSLGGKRNPIESIKSRLKSLRSIQEKLHRRGVGNTCEEIEATLNDIAGVRIICGYVDDIYMLTDCFINQDDVIPVEIKDYIKNPKPNGYRSLHLIVEIPIFLLNEKRPVRVEIQLRTIAMESWANLEHGIRYKKEMSQETKNMIADKLNYCAELSRMLDEQMQVIRDIVE